MSSTELTEVIDGGTSKDPEYVGLAFHTPHRLPQTMLSELANPADRRRIRRRERNVWLRVHAILDKEMNRI